jgi:hypothetical protein
MTQQRLVARAVAVIGLAGIALIHLLDLPGKFHEVPYLGVLYVVLIAGTLVAGALLVHGDSSVGWLLGGGLAFATIVGYVLNRTVGLPRARDDVGNWLEPLGLASLFVEAVVVALAAYALSRRDVTAAPATRVDRVPAERR